MGAIPPNSSLLTANPHDDFESLTEWIALHTELTTGDAAAFWYVMGQFTRTQHWNRTIFDVSMQSEALEALDSHRDINSCALPTVSSPRPPLGTRYIALRELHRKTGSPIGGGVDGNEKSFSCHEWTTQYVRLGVNRERHIAVFGLVIPQNIVDEENPRAMTYWPFHYPKSRCYRYTCEALSEDERARCSHTHRLSFEVVPLGVKRSRPGSRPLDDVLSHASRAAAKQLVQVRKRMENFDSVRGVSTYVKRVHHDKLVPERLYRTHYARLKSRYAAHWVQTWSETEVTDPVKFVFEEMAIAAYLCALWQLERQSACTQRMQTFVDCGCGNGFLVYLLRMEGHLGVGVDVQRRKIWDRYPSHVTEALRHEEIDPQSYDASQYDWIVGNHSDELTPWLPVIAARAQRKNTQINGRRDAHPKLFVLPCCFFDVDGKKLAFGNRRRTVTVPHTGVVGKYEQYVTWIRRICVAVGLDVVQENLRIPSTKYIALLCTRIEYADRMQDDVIASFARLLLLDAQLSHS